MVYNDFTDALVRVIPSMKLVSGERVEFEVAGFPDRENTKKYRLTLQQMDEATELYPGLEIFFDEEWQPDSRLLELILAIALVRRARQEGFWL